MYLYDGRGSVSGVVNPQDEMISYRYTAYGDLMPSSPQPTVFGYNAEATDYETGLQYLRARYYNVSNSRFMQEDDYRGEFDDPLSLNRYTYVQNDPINYTDPSGYRQVEDAFGYKIQMPEKPDPNQPEPNQSEPSPLKKWVPIVKPQLIDGGTGEEKNEVAAYIEEQIGYTHHETVTAYDENNNPVSITVNVTADNGLCDEAVSWNTGSLQEAIDIFNRFKARGYQEGSYALEMLYQTLFSKAVGKMSTEELMAQFAAQFTGEEGEKANGNSGLYYEDKIDTGEEYHMPYDGANRSSFDKYNDCSGFVYELYNTFLNYQLHNESADGQFGNEKDITVKNIAFDEYEKIAQVGDLIYYNDPAYKKTDAHHVVMYIGNGLVVQQANKKSDLIITTLKSKYFVGYIRLD